MGADATINYRATPDWTREVNRLTDRAGADLIVEVGGAGTIVQSISAGAVVGRIVLVGVLGGRRNEVDVSAVFAKNLRILGVSVGSRAQFEQMCTAITHPGMRPAVDRAYPFEDVPQALRDMESGAHFGKLTIRS